MSKLIWTVAEVAKEKGCHKVTVRRAIEAGRLKATRVGSLFVMSDEAVNGWEPYTPGNPDRTGARKNG